MKLAALSLRDLEYVAAVAEHLHFGRAAIACGVSQPTLSAQIRKLEESIGFDIFERSGRTLIVTGRGSQVLAQANVVLDESQRLLDLVAAVAEPLSGTFRLGLISTLGPYVTPLLLQPLRDRFTRLRVILSEGLTLHLVQALEAGGIDALLATSPLRGGDLEELPIFRESLVLAVPRHHRLAAVPHVALADIDPDDLILLDGGHCLRDHTLKLFPGIREPARHLQAAGIESLRQMIGAGMGCALLPQLAVQVGALADDMVAYRSLGADAPERRFSLFYRASFGRIRDIRALRDLVRDTLQAVGTVKVERRTPSAVSEGVG